MADSSALQDLDNALGSGYLIVREMPQAAGFHTYAARSKSDGSNVEIKTLSIAQIGGTVPVSDVDLESRRIQHPNVVPMIMFRLKTSSMQRFFRRRSLARWDSMKRFE